MKHERTVVVLAVILLLCVCVVFGMMVGSRKEVPAHIPTPASTSLPTTIPSYTKTAMPISTEAVQSTSTATVHTAVPVQIATSTPGCDPNYGSVCLPYEIGDTLNCTDISERNFLVLGIDHHHLDRDKNGIACEE